jgi:hypothetical protein
MLVAVGFLEGVELTIPSKKALNVFTFYPDNFHTAPLSRASSPQGIVST